MKPNLQQLAWPLARVAEAMEALARRQGLPTQPTRLASEHLVPEQEWIEDTARALGLEAEEMEIPYVEVETQLRSAPPTLLRLPVTDTPRYLALMGHRRKVLVLGPDQAEGKFAPEAIRAAVCQAMEGPFVSQSDQLLDEAGISKSRRAPAQKAILRERLGSTPIGGCWVLRLPPESNLWLRLHTARIPKLFAALVAAHALQFSLWILAWWLVGQGAMEGRLNRGWLFAWALMLPSLVYFRLIMTWLEGQISIRTGGMLKRHLLHSTLQSEPDEIRAQGVGQLMGRVMEADAVEFLFLSCGLSGLLALVELIMSAAVLAAGAGGWLQMCLLGGCITVILLLAYHYLRRCQLWTGARLEMTHDLVEHLVGHRTRLAQEVSEHWHEEEDQALASYQRSTRALDWSIVLMELVPRGWLILGILGLLPAFVSGSGSPVQIAIGVGGTLLACQALKRLTIGVEYFVGARISWKQVAQFFHAANRSKPVDRPARSRLPLRHAVEGEKNSLLLEARDLSFCYPDRNRPVLDGCSLRISAGEQILLEGASGSGKSTLVSLLAGLRQQKSGRLVLNGFDIHSWGTESWRQQVVLVPQFHENQVLTGSFAFNLLMGRHWPPRPVDLEEAEAVCRELGMEKLLQNMPAGIWQPVGEGGWQLSQGERSRLFIARALLQKADFLILDESFAGVDHESLPQVLSCVLKRAPTLLVIAHA